MLGIHTPIGSAFNPDVYLYCELLHSEIKKVSLFWGEIAKTVVAEGGFPHSHITLSQNVNILVKTKNAPKALKRKIELIFIGPRSPGPIYVSGL